MRSRRCKTCFWHYQVTFHIGESRLNCDHKERAIIECAGERSKVGNCGPSGKHWERMKDINELEILKGGEL